VFISISAMALAAGNFHQVFNDNGKEVIVYPNPVLDNKFKVETNQEIIEITVLNVLGQPVFNQKYIQTNTVSIELETRDKGVFIVQVKTSDGTLSNKRILLK
jgi:hypothetical protein